LGIKESIVLLIADYVVKENVIKKFARGRFDAREYTIFYLTQRETRA